MRYLYLFFSLLCILALAACGTEEELIPPAFSNIMVNGAPVTSTPYSGPSVTISGNIDDVTATIVANSTVTGEVPVIVESDGSWSFTFTPQEGANLVSLTASDARGNINQLILSVTHDMTPPIVIAVTQSVADSENPQLIVTFNEALLESSVTANPFAVIGATIISATLDTNLTKRSVTLALDAALPAGTHQLTCTGVTDLATPAGNSVAADYSFPFTIIPIVE
jgi:hypothetical protein